MNNRCPRCGGKSSAKQPDAMSRCEYCGALLVAPGLAGPPLQATPRFDTLEARTRVHRALREDRTVEWRVSIPQLVFYPFAIDGPARSPFRPLATLPPLMAAAWKPSGADLTRELGESDDSDNEETLAAARIPIAEDVDPSTPVVMYPFYRMSLTSGTTESACWCDGVDGQVMLPEDVGIKEQIPQATTLKKIGHWSLLVSAGASLILPFPFSLFAVLAAGGVFWARVTRW